MSFVAEIDKLYAAADMVISRSGAATLSELCCTARPVLLVPSPNVAENHQYHNAMALANKGAALVITEKDLDLNFPKCFKLLLDRKKRNEMSKSLKALAQPNATAKIVDLIEALL